MIKYLLQKFFEAYCWVVLHTYIKVKVHGKSNLPQGQYLLVSNHSSHLDYLILAIFSGKGFSKMSVIAAKDYWFDKKARDWFTRTFLNAIPINRKKLYQPDLLGDIIDKCKSELKTYKSMVVFPEGKRSPNGQIQTFKQGASIIAKELELPIVPAYIQGSYYAWPKGKQFMKPSKINLYFGKPIFLNNSHYDKPNPKEVIRQLERHVHQLKKQHIENQEPRSKPTKYE